MYVLAFAGFPKHCPSRTFYARLDLDKLKPNSRAPNVMLPAGQDQRMAVWRHAVPAVAAIHVKAGPLYAEPALCY